MRKRWTALSLLATLALVIVACAPAKPNPTQGSTGPAPSGQAPAAASSGPTRVAIGVTETIESQNPYADSISLGYGIWCEVLGCLVSRNIQSREYAPSLAESWKVENPTTWLIRTAWRLSPL